MYHCNEASYDKRPGSVGAMSRFTTSRLVLQQVATFYKAVINIPMVSESWACTKIVKLLEENNKLHAIDKSHEQHTSHSASTEGNAMSANSINI